MSAPPPSDAGPSAGCFHATPGDLGPGVAPAQGLKAAWPVIRLAGALLLEQSDEWAVQRSRYMTLESAVSMADDPAISLPAVAR